MLNCLCSICFNQYGGEGKCEDFFFCEMVNKTFYLFHWIFLLFNSTVAGITSSKLSIMPMAVSMFS